MEKLRVPLWVSTVYFLLLGLSTLSRSVIRRVYGYEVRDPGVLLVLSAALFGLGVILGGVARKPEKHGSLAPAITFSLLIFIAFLLWGWARHFFTVRSVAIPVVIDLVLAAWIWSAGPKT